MTHSNGATASIFEHPVYIGLGDSDLAEDIARELRNQGFRARQFINTDVLRNAARKAPPAAVILDLDLLDSPDSVLDLMVSLSEGAGWDVPLVGLSASGDIEARRRAVRAGCAALMTLPLNPTVLSYHLRRLIKGVESPDIRLLAFGSDATFLEHVAALNSGQTRIQTADTAEALIRAAETTDIDGVLIDADQHGEDPVELIHMLRQLPNGVNAPIFIATGQDKRRFDEAALHHGIDAIIGLPISGRDLQAILTARIKRTTDLREAYRYMSRRDIATGLFNREAFDETLAGALRSPSTQKNQTALFFIQISEVQGDQGDARLATERAEVFIANQLRANLSAFAVPARVDRGAFAVLLFNPNMAELEHLIGLLQEQLSSFQFRIADQIYTGHCAVGMTMLGEHLRNEDEALARAQASAEIRTHGATAEERASQNRQRTAALEHWGDRLKQALRENRFRLVYQPIASLSGSPTPFYEVLVRMLDESGNDILPREFLPAVEHHQLMRELDRWVVGRALHVLESYDEHGHKPVLFIKLFSDTVVDDGFAEWFSQQQGGSGIEASRLVFEIDHAVALAHLSEASKLAKALTQLGSHVAVEHFGKRSTDTGILSQMPMKYLKLAGNLTDDVADSAEHQKLIQSTTGLARQHKIATVAALVQDASNLSVLWQCGVEYIQGYFMQEPADIFDTEAEL